MGKDRGRSKVGSYNRQGRIAAGSVDVEESHLQLEGNQESAEGLHWRHCKEERRSIAAWNWEGQRKGGSVES